MAINSIAIKQIIGAWAFDSAETIKWMVSNVENLQITQDGETTEKRDTITLLSKATRQALSFSVQR